MFMPSIKQMYSDKEKTQKAYPKVWLPIGTVYFNKTDISDEINQYFEGIWERCLEGEVPVGVKEGDTDFGVSWVAVGTKTVTLTVDQMPSHTHTFDRMPHFFAEIQNTNEILAERTTTAAKITDSTASRGGGEPHSNIQPSRTLYAWIRTS